MTAELAVLTIFTAVLAGVSWNTIGIWRAYRENQTHSIDGKKFLRNAIIGAIIGIIAYGLSLVSANPITITPTIEGFFFAIAGFFPIVVIAERIFLNSNKQ